MDYWNRLGWTDPFSSDRFSARQQQYSRRFGLDGVYTPQMVIDGSFQAVGSDSESILQAIRRAARKPHVDLDLTVMGSTVRVSADHIAQHGDVEVLYGITESLLRSDVRKGENAGRMLSHTGVVRRLTKIADYNSRKQEALSIDVPLALDPGWNRANMRAVAFIQNKNEGAVIGAVSRRLSS